MAGKLGDLYGSFISVQSTPFVLVSLVSYARSCLEAGHPIKIGIHFSSVFKIVVYAAPNKHHPSHTRSCTRLGPWCPKHQAPPCIFPHRVDA